jgi:hypothetical protein
VAVAASVVAMEVAVTLALAVVVAPAVAVTVASGVVQTWSGIAAGLMLMHELAKVIAALSVNESGTMPSPFRGNREALRGRRITRPVQERSLGSV